jgi:hypothetical protein
MKECIELEEQSAMPTEFSVSVLLAMQTALAKVPAEEIIDHHPGLIQESKTHFVWERGRYHPIVQEILDAIYQSGIQQSFYCDPWNRNAISLSRQPERISRARMTTCLKLLTFHSRVDHFCEGHMAEMIIQGQIAALFSRIRHLGRGRVR